MAGGMRKTVASLYASHSSIPHLLAAADRACRHSFPIGGSLLHARKGLSQLLSRFAETRCKLRGFEVSHASPYRISLPVRNPTPKLKAKAVGAFAWEDEGGLVFLLGQTHEVRYVVHELQSYLAGEVTAVYFRTSDIPRSLGDACRQDDQLEIAVSGYTASILQGGQDRQIKTRREWFTSPEPFQDFFSELEDETQWVRSLHLQLLGQASARGRVSRDMSFSCDMGLQVFFHNVIHPLARVINARRELFAKRSVEESPSHTVKPLRITYDSRLFENVRENHRLIHTLRKLPDATVSVFHPNPFLHAAVTDYTDGSSFTIWIVNDSSLLIVPGTRTTSGSLERFCNHVNEYFSEGRVEEALE